MSMSDDGEIEHQTRGRSKPRCDLLDSSHIVNTLQNPSGKRNRQLTRLYINMTPCWRDERQVGYELSKAIYTGGNVSISRENLLRQIL